MARSVTPFLMFQGTAEAAITFYTSIFSDSKMDFLEKYGPGEPGQAGTVKRAVFQVAGQRVMCIDSPVKHAFTFTPATSLFVECETESELDRVVNQLAEGGALLMPPGNYGFSTKFAWLCDRFGVSWQLNLQ